MGYLVDGDRKEEQMKNCIFVLIATKTSRINVFTYTHTSLLSWRSDKKTEFRKWEEENKSSFWNERKNKLAQTISRRKKKEKAREKGLVARRLVGNETDALHLAGVVKSDDTDECGGVSFLALFKLFQHLGSVAASKHRELPHDPVAAIVVPRRGVVLTVNERVLHNTCTYNRITCHNYFFCGAVIRSSRAKY